MASSVESTLEYFGDDPQNTDKLLPELKPFLREHGGAFGGPGLFHPFVVDPLFTSWKLDNRIYESKCKMYDEALAKKDWSRIFHVVLERAFRLPTLADWWRERKITREELRELLPTIWTDAEPASELRWLSLFRAATKDDGTILSPEGTELPDGDTVTIYRGQPKAGKKYLGIAWSLQPATARFFATRFGQQGVIVTGRVKRQSIYAYLQDRGEAEIIAHPKDVQLLAVEPVSTDRIRSTSDQLYQAYMGSTKDSREVAS